MCWQQAMSKNGGLGVKIKKEQKTQGIWIDHEGREVLLSGGRVESSRCYMV